MYKRQELEALASGLRPERNNSAGDSGFPGPAAFPVCPESPDSVTARNAALTGRIGCRAIAGEARISR